MAYYFIALKLKKGQPRPKSYRMKEKLKWSGFTHVVAAVVAFVVLFEKKKKKLQKKSKSMMHWTVYFQRSSQKHRLHLLTIFVGIISIDINCSRPVINLWQVLEKN